MHEDEAEVLRQVDAPASGDELSEMKKEKDSDDDDELDSLCTTPPGSPKEEVKCESEEEYPLCLTPASPPRSMAPLAPRHETNGYWPQHPNELYAPLHPIEAHVVAARTNGKFVIVLCCRKA